MSPNLKHLRAPFRESDNIEIVYICNFLPLTSIKGPLLSLVSMKFFLWHFSWTRYVFPCKYAVNPWSTHYISKQPGMFRILNGLVNIQMWNIIDTYGIAGFLSPLLSSSLWYVYANYRVHYNLYCYSLVCALYIVIIIMQISLCTKFQTLVRYILSGVYLSLIESTETTSMEDVSTGVLEKNREYLRSKDKAQNVMMYQDI